MANHIRKQTVSMRGEPVNWDAMRATNATQRTLGNTNTNVRGDILGPNGVVLKTQEEVEAEWAAKRALQERINQEANIKADKIAQSTAAPPQRAKNTPPAPPADDVHE
jgi:hypothetical protein